MRAAFVAAMAEWSDREFILDGWPRNQPQSLLLPDDTKTILLTCRPDIARDRLYRRGREDDQFAEKRIREQGDLLQIDIAGGWVFKFVGWEGAINTTYRTRQDVARSVYRYLIGEKGQAFDG
jgi:hypothetical protein